MAWLSSAQLSPAPPPARPPGAQHQRRASLLLGYSERVAKGFRDEQGGAGAEKRERHRAGIELKRERFIPGYDNVLPKAGIASFLQFGPSSFNKIKSGGEGVRS